MGRWRIDQCKLRVVREAFPVEGGITYRQGWRRVHPKGIGSFETYHKYFHENVTIGALVAEGRLYRRKTGHFLNLAKTPPIEDALEYQERLWQRQTKPIVAQVASGRRETLPTFYKAGGYTIENEMALAELVTWAFNTLLFQYRSFLETLVTQANRADARRLTQLFFEGMSGSPLEDISEQAWRRRNQIISGGTLRCLEDTVFRLHVLHRLRALKRARG
jgi:hypothetical protein